MRAEKQAQPSRDRARRLTRKTLAAGGVVTTLAVVGSFAGLGAATAAETDVTEAEGRFLTFDGALGDTVNALAELAPAYSATPSGEPENSRSLDLELLSALDISLGDGLQLFGENPILGLGALGQYSRTDATSSYASSGLLGEEGAIAPAAGSDPSENAYLDLAPILGAAGLDALLSEARLELGAISASATATDGSEPVGDYQIAGGTLVLTSPAIDDLSSGLVGALDQVSGPINELVGEGGTIEQTVDPLLGGLTGALDGVLAIVGGSVELGVTANVNLDLAAAVASVLEEPLTSDDSVVTIDLSAGTVSVDLARLVADTQGGDYDGTLNGLPANTELLSPDLVQAALDGALGSTLDQVPALVVNAVTDALNAAEVNIEIAGAVDGPLGVNLGQIDVQIAGALGDFLGVEGSEEPTISTEGTNVAGLPVGQLLEPLLEGITNTILPALVTPLSEAITDEGTLDTIFRPVVEAANAVLTPLFGLVTNNLLSLTANVQETGGTFTHENAVDTENTFTERALELTLLPNSPILQLALGSATVRGDFDAAPVYDTAITVEPGTIAQGETATIEGSGFAPNESVSVTIDGVEVGPVDTDENGDFTLGYDAPADAETGTFVVIAEGETSQTPAEGSLTIEAGDAGSDADVNAAADVDGDENTNASASASASANADDESNASAQVAAQAAATADADTTASAAADADATAAAESAATADASSDASADVSSDVNASAQAAAQAAANADASSTSNAEASAAADASVDAAAASQAASNADSSSDASASAAANADADVNGGVDADVSGAVDSDVDADVNADADVDGDENTNASSSASASANADDESNASAQVAAQAAATADADTTASAAADADATAAAESAATADASSDASADVSSDVNASAQAASQAAAQADASSTSNADATSAANSNASAASAAASNADSSTDASSEAAANADADVDGAADADGGENTNASASASASANADDESNASAQTAAQAAATADADTTASAASDADATAAAQSAATADASSDASADVSSDVNASAQAAAQAAANADASSASNAEASAASDASANAAAASQAASNADSSSDASSEAAASSDSDASASASASSDDDANASSDDDASASSDSDSSSASDSESASNANASSAADGQQISMELENDRLMVGQEQVAHGHGFQPGESVSAAQYSEKFDIGTAVADDNGDVTFTWSVPNGTEVGNHMVELTGATSGSVDATFEVYTSTGGGALSPTGGDMALPLGGLAAAMLLAGAGVWFAVRRRAHA